MDGTGSEEPKLIAVIKQAVSKSGLSLSELARKSGVDQAAISRFMLGQRTLTLKSAAKLFDVLNLEVVEGRGAEQPETEPRAPKRPRGKPSRDK